jgi:hypothetical protein
VIRFFGGVDQNNNGVDIGKTVYPCFEVNLLENGISMDKAQLFDMAIGLPPL